MSAMQRRTVIQSALGSLVASPLLAALQQDQFDAAAGILTNAVETGQIHAAALYVQQGTTIFARSFGGAKSATAVFLLASITKPISVAALLSLHDCGHFQLDDTVKKFIPGFSDNPRDRITVRQLLTHVSGLPDQLPENSDLRRRHAPLPDFVELAVRTPLLFEPGSRVQLLQHGDSAGRGSGTAHQQNRIPKTR